MIFHQVSIFTDITDSHLEDCFLAMFSTPCENLINILESNKDLTISIENRNRIVSLLTKTYRNFYDRLVYLNYSEKEAFWLLLNTVETIHCIHLNLTKLGVSAPTVYVRVLGEFKND